MSEDSKETSLALKEYDVPEVDFIDTLLYVPFAVIFFLTMCFFDVLHRIAFMIGGRKLLKRVVHVMSWFLIHELRFVGFSVEICGETNLPAGVPYIFVANHQSLFDIPLIGWVFGRYTPQFISKVELSKGIPGTSFSLRHSGDVIIDRSQGSAAFKEIVKFGRRINEENTSAVLYPEGTRARRGALKDFKMAGFSGLLKSAPRAVVVPIVIDNSWKLAAYRFGPIPRGGKLVMHIGKPILPEERGDDQHVVDLTYTYIKNELEAIRARS